MPALRLLLLSLAASLVSFLAHAAGAVVTTEQVRAELVAQAAEGVTPGRPLWLGLLIEHQPHWHTYWKNPGDSGLPTTLAWQLPKGLTAGEIAWPTPKKLPVGPLVNYGYEGKLLLPVPVSVSPTFSGNTLDVRLSAQWLVCKDICIPQQGRVRTQRPGAGKHGQALGAVRRGAGRRAAGGRRRQGLRRAGRRCPDAARDRDRPARGDAGPLAHLFP
jgi:thiol:disulfide interchange protein DsbD